MTKENYPDNVIYKYILPFFACWGIQLATGITVRNPLTVVLFVCFCAVNKWLSGYKYVKKTTLPMIPLTHGVSLGVGGLVTFLLYKDRTAQFTSGLFRLLTVLILFVGFYALGVILIRLALHLCLKDNFEKKPGEEVTTSEKELTPSLEYLIFIITAFVCLLMYLPYYLYEYPGIMTADSLVQYEQIIGETAYSNHHPVIHTLTIKLFYELGVKLMGDSIGGIACYTLFQMIFISLCSAFAVREVIRVEQKVVVWHVVLAIAFFALMPFNAVFAVTVWKDVPFAGIAVLLSCHIIEMYRKRQDRIRLTDYFGFILLSVLFMLYRSNAFFAFIPFAVLFVIAFREKLTASIVVVAVSIAIVVAVKGPVFKAYGVTSPDFVESLSVPLQQVARVLVDDGNVSEDDLGLIDQVIDRTYVKELYVPNYADNIKELVRAGHPEVLESNKGQYLGLYLRLFSRNAISYIKAWYDLEGGYIYPDVAYSVGDVDGIMANDMGLYSMPIIGGKFIKVKEILIKLSDFMPIYGMFFSIGAYMWGIVAGLYFVIKHRNITLIHILMLLLVATLLIAAPVVDFRYGYAYVLTMPVWLSLPFMQGKKGV